MTRRPTLWLVALFGAATPALAWAQQAQDYGHGPHMWGGAWHGWFLGPVMMILLVAVVVILIVLIVRWLGGPSHAHAPSAPPGRTPLDILKERFARGEIDKEEFEERRRVLGD